MVWVLWIKFFFLCSLNRDERHCSFLLIAKILTAYLSVVFNVRSCKKLLILCMGSKLSSGIEIMKTLSVSERSDSNSRSEQFYNLMKMRRKHSE